MTTPTTRKRATRNKNSESYFQSQVVKDARRNNWHVTFWPNSKWGGKGRAGFPDLALRRTLPDGERQVMFLELKTKTGHVQPDQWEWHFALGAYVPTFIVRPEHRETGVLEQLLTEGGMIDADGIDGSLFGGQEVPVLPVPEGADQDGI